MKRFVLMVFLFWAVLAILMIGARGYGETHPTPDELAAVGFNVCGDYVCFLGIQPKLALPVEQVNTQLSAIPGVQRSSTLSLTGNVTVFDWTIPTPDGIVAVNQDRAFNWSWAVYSQFTSTI